MRNLFALLLSATLLYSYSTAKAGPYSELVVFGDSLSDAGNVLSVTSTLADADPRFMPDPPAALGYFNGRASNGPLWVDQLAVGLRLPGLTASLGGGTGYAYAGSKSGIGTNVRFPSPTFPPNPPINVVRSGSQIDDYLGSRTAFNSTQLITLWTGANDIRDATGPGDILAIVNNLETEIRKLGANGAKNIIVPNQPNAALAPFFKLPGAPNPNAIAAAIGAFNSLLGQRLALLQQDASLNLNLIPLDTFALSNEIAANPGTFGFTNINAPAVAFNPQTGQFTIASGAASYLFYDLIHPSSKFHQVIADRAFAALAVPLPSSAWLLLIGIAPLIARRRN